MYGKNKQLKNRGRLAQGSKRKPISTSTDRSRPGSCPSRHEKSSVDGNLLEIKLYEPSLSRPASEEFLNGSDKNNKNRSTSRRRNLNLNTNGNRRARAKTFNFRILVNSGGGDCLFLTLSEFLGDRKNGGSASYLNVLHDQIRKRIVNYIIKPDSGPENGYNFRSKSQLENYGIWNRYRQGIKISLEKHVRFFRNFNIDNTDERIEALAREEYQKYMSQSGIFGTYVELCAAMELYSFSTTLIEEASASNQPAYFVYHLDLADGDSETSTNQKKPGKKPTTLRAHILFTGSIDQGHFELLQPIKPKKPTTIPKGVYGVQERNDKHRFIALVQDGNTTAGDDKGKENKMDAGSVTTKYNINPFVNNYNSLLNKSGLKRTATLLCPSKSKERSAASPKRMRTRSWNDKNENSIGTHNSNDKISQILHHSGSATVSKMNSTLLLQHELEKLAQLYTVTLSELKSSFEVRISDEAMKQGQEEWPGVRNSRVLSFGRFQTAFMHFLPYTFTPFCPTMGDVHCIMYNGDSVLVTELDKDEIEIDCSLKTGEFTLEIGGVYTLENNSDYSVLLRVLWID